MEKYFPLYFKKTKNEVTRGLSSLQSENDKNKPNVLNNPRDVLDRSPEYKMTLVWDLDQTLISADGIDDEDENDVNTLLVIRPHAREILSILKRNSDVEFIIWTAGTKNHAERVVCSFPEINFNYIISRDPCWYSYKNPTKNLNLIVGSNRTLDSIILIDDRMDIGTEHPENLLVVPPYYPKKHYASDDSTMLYLVNIIQRAINLYREKNKHSFSAYLFSPLSEKCTYNEHTYYGVKCFENKTELNNRINSFQMLTSPIGYCNTK